MSRFIKIASLSLALSVGVSGAVLAAPADTGAMSSHPMSSTNSSMGAGGHMTSGAMASGAMASSMSATPTEKTKKAKKVTAAGSMSSGAMASH